MVGCSSEAAGTFDEAVREASARAAGLSPWAQVLALAASTLVSEDLTCIAAGLLAHQQHLSLPVGVAGCFIGIYVGDLGLWLIGRLIGAGLLRWRWLRRRLPMTRIERAGEWFDRCGWRAVWASRFLPGTRVAVYLAAGLLGRRPWRFALWTLGAVGVWTPLVVGAVAVFGRGVLGPLEAWLGSAWMALLLGIVVMFVLVRTAALLATSVGRRMLIARVSRLWRWEFWPAWLFYLPVMPYLLWLGVRYRGLTVPTAANPGMPHGGVAGESKYEILSRLPQEWIVPSVLISTGSVAARRAELDRVVSERGWTFPLILKPDVGERGAGVRLARTLEDARAYLERNEYPVLVQTYHPGPYEAGIFYYRLPGEAHGRIFSITDKAFPVVTGDGLSTVGELIWKHPRFRMQAQRFLERLDGRTSHILAAGERLPLAVSGNHCQGTMFLDGRCLITPELEARIDDIARAYDGFYIGRFDVRYRDADAFRAGRDLAIIELNGISSESTNVYDPRGSLVGAYRTLYRQARLLFEIGHLNRSAGHRPTPLGTLIREIRSYLRTQSASALAD